MFCNIFIFLSLFFNVLLILLYNFCAAASSFHFFAFLIAFFNFKNDFNNHFYLHFLIFLIVVYITLCVFDLFEAPWLSM